MALSWLRCVERQLLLMMFLYHGRRMDDPVLPSTASGKFNGLSTQQVEEAFNQSVCGNPVTMVALWLWWLCWVSLSAHLACKRGLERVTKYMMIALLVIMVILAINSFTMDGAKEGLSFLSETRLPEDGKLALEMLWWQR